MCVVETDHEGAESGGVKHFRYSLGALNVWPASHPAGSGSNTLTRGINLPIA